MVSRITDHSILVMVVRPIARKSQTLKEGYQASQLGRMGMGMGVSVELVVYVRV